MTISTTNGCYCCSLRTNSPISTPSISNGTLPLSSDIKPELADFEPSHATSGLNDVLGITSRDSLNVNPPAPSGVSDGDATGHPPRVVVLVVDDRGVAASVVRAVGGASGDFDASNVGATRVSGVLSSVLTQCKLGNRQRVSEPCV